MSGLHDLDIRQRGNVEVRFANRTYFEK